MKQKKIFLFIFMLLFIGNGFSQSASKLTSKAKKAYNKGDYVSASLLSMKALKLKPKKKKPQEILSNSFELAREDLLDKIENLKNSSANFEGDKTVTQKAKIVKLYKTLKKLDRNLRLINKKIKKSKYDLDFEPLDIEDQYKQAVAELEESKKQAAEMYYNKGLALMNNNNRDSYKQAAKNFKQALRYVPDYKQANELYEEARKKGTARVAILAFENKSGNMNFGAIGESVSDKLISKLMRNKDAMEFTEFISRDELDRVMSEHQLNASSAVNKSTIAKFGEIMGVNILITGKITQVSYEHGRTIENGPYTEENKVVVGQEKYVNSKGKTRTRSVYGVVRANVWTYQKVSKAILSGSYKVIDVDTGRILKQGQFTEKYDWENNWLKFQGDRRAINFNKYKNDGGEQQPPSDFEMGNILINKLTDKMEKELTKILN